MVALIHGENHASNKGKTAGRYQFDTHPTRIGLNWFLPSNQTPAIKIKTSFVI